MEHNHFPDLRKHPTSMASTDPASGPGGLDHGRLARLLGYHLARARVPGDQVFHEHIGRHFQLRPVEFTVVALLAANEQVTSTRLCRALHVSAPNMTVLLDRLEERGLVRRVRSESDRRVQFIELTRQGAALAKKADARAEAMEREWLEPLSERERVTLFRLLAKIGAPDR